MFCIYCGKQIQDGSKFCLYCGAKLSASDGSPAPEAPAYTPPEAGGSDTVQQADQSVGGKKRRGRGLIIGGAVALVLVAAVVAAVIGGLFASPKGRVERALLKTMSAYSQAINKTGVPNLSKLIKDKSYSQRVSVELNSINRDLFYWYDLSGLKGLGMRVNTDFDQKGRKIGLDAAVSWDGDDMASLQMLVNNNIITFSSPEFTDGNAYGFNTETLGADLHKLGVDDSSVNVKKISFNVFDLLEKGAYSEDRTKEMTKAISKANKELLDAVEVDKGVKKSVQVNGKRMDATLYNVVVPKSAMKDYVSSMIDVMKTADTKDMTKDILQSMGFDKATINEIMSRTVTADSYDQIASTLKDAVKAIGDVELEVYVSGGYVVAVEYSGSIEGSDVDIELQLGGGDNYVDDLSLEITAGGDKLTIESSGNHAGKGGVFTDETVIRTDYDSISSELRYKPKDSSGNLEWELRMSSTASVSIEGQLTTTKNSIDLQLDELTVKASGIKLASLEADYYLGPCKGITLSHASPKLLADMDLDDLYDLKDSAEDWAYDLVKRFPALYHIF